MWLKTRVDAGELAFYRGAKNLKKKKNKNQENGKVSNFQLPEVVTES